MTPLNYSLTKFSPVVVRLREMLEEKGSMGQRTPSKHVLLIQFSNKKSYLILELVTKTYGKNTAFLNNVHYYIYTFSLFGTQHFYFILHIQNHFIQSMHLLLFQKIMML